MARKPVHPYASVERVLGSKPLHIDSPIMLHERIVKGFPRRMVVHLVSGFRIIKQAESFRALGLSTRTWHRIKADVGNGAVDADLSARVWSLAEVLAKAEEVFGTREAAEEWMSKPAIGLDSNRPIDLMATPQGAALVKTLLEQMEYGVYA